MPSEVFASRSGGVQSSLASFHTEPALIWSEESMRSRLLQLPGDVWYIDWHISFILHLERWEVFLPFSPCAGRPCSMTTLSNQWAFVARHSLRSQKRVANSSGYVRARRVLTERCDREVEPIEKEAKDRSGWQICSIMTASCTMHGMSCHELRVAWLRVS